MGTTEVQHGSPRRARPERGPASRSLEWWNRILPDAGRERREAMRKETVRLMAAVFVCGLLVTAAWAAGGESNPTTTPAKTPEQLADQAYNEGLSYRDEAWTLEERLAAADDDQKAKLRKKIDKNYERAIDSYRDALKQDPDHYQALSSLGYALRKTGRYEEALEAYDEALGIEPGYAEAIEYRAEAYLGLNRIEEAKQAYMKLFDGNRAMADQLLGAMQQWVERNPGGVDASTLEAFSGWIEERAEIAGNTTPVSELRDKSW
jgi:tetratricopeptide (TPR) repeat protein